MDIRYIGSSAVALYLNENDLKERQMDLESINIKQAAALLDVEGWERAEFEIFAGKDSILVIAWDRSRTPYCFAFESFEDMISAVSECPQDQNSKLICYNEMYILTLYPEKGEELCPALYEFGEMLGNTEGFVLHIEEQGEEVITTNAVNMLKKLLRP